jgi:hypothetical protein
MPKQKLTLSIDKDIITQARKANINLSSFLEIRLSEYLSECKISGRGGIRTRVAGSKGRRHDSRSCLSGGFKRKFFVLNSSFLKK